MLRQACVADLRDGSVARSDGYIVVAMRQYPRGLAKELRDEYLRELAPSAELLKTFLAEKKRHGGDHNYAFHAAGYERLFEPSPKAVGELERLAQLSRTQDVLLVCQCGEAERCHRELLLLLGRAWFGAQIERLRFAYPVFEARIRRGGRLA